MCSDVAFVIVILRFLKNNLYLKLNSSCKGVCVCLGLALIYAFYCGVLFWQNKFYEEHKYIASKKEAAPDEIVFYDAIRDVPWWTLQHPMYGIWYSEMHTIHFNVWNNRKEIVACVLPTVFKDMDFSDLKPIGTSEKYYQVGDYLLFRFYGKFDDCIRIPHNYIFTLENGSEIGTYVSHLPMKYEDGYVWMVGIPSKTKVKGPFMHIEDGCH